MRQEQPDIGVVIVDDHPMTRLGLTFMLKTFDGITLLGEATNGKEALALCSATTPDVALIDMLLPDRSGPDLVYALRQQQPDLKIVALSSSDDRDLIERALKAGAISYMLKSMTAAELALTIRQAFVGQATLAPEAVQVLVEQMRRPHQEKIAFTERERSVLKLMAQGQSNVQIAAALFISPATVKGNVAALISKLGVTTRSEAIARAWAQGMIKPDELAT